MLAGWGPASAAEAVRLKELGDPSLWDQMTAVMAEINAAHPDPSAPQPTLEEAKASAILRCEAETQAYILAQYPWHRQANITRHEAARDSAPPPVLDTMYTHEDFLTMCSYIDSARTVCELGRQAFDACREAVQLEQVWGLLSSARDCTTAEDLAAAMTAIQEFIAEVSQ